MYLGAGLLRSSIGGVGVAPCDDCCYVGGWGNIRPPEGQKCWRAVWRRRRSAGWWRWTGRSGHPGSSSSYAREQAPSGGASSAPAVPLLSCGLEAADLHLRKAEDLKHCGVAPDWGQEKTKQEQNRILSSARPTINKIQTDLELTSCLDIPWRQSFLDFSSVWHKRRQRWTDASQKTKLHWKRISNTFCIRTICLLHMSTLKSCWTHSHIKTSVLVILPVLFWPLLSKCWYSVSVLRWIFPGSSGSLR